MLAHSTQSQAVSLRLAGLLLFQSDSDGLRGCLAGSVVLNVSGSLCSQRPPSAKEMLQQSLTVAVATPVICLQLNGETNGINKKVHIFNKLRAPFFGSHTLLAQKYPHHTVASRHTNIA